MTGTLRTVYRFGIALLALWLVVLVFLAGLGIFELIGDAAEGAASEESVDDSLGVHAGLGFFFGPASLLLGLVALGARLGRNRVLFTFGILVLWFLQETFAGVGEDAPVVGALHPVNALVMLALVTYLAHGAWRRWDDVGDPVGSPSRERV